MGDKRQQNLSVCIQMLMYIYNDFLLYIYLEEDDLNLILKIFNFIIF